MKAYFNCGKSTKKKLNQLFAIILVGGIAVSLNVFLSWQMTGFYIILQGIFKPK